MTGQTKMVPIEETKSKHNLFICGHNKNTVVV
jgi:hypothetical protein